MDNSLRNALLTMFCTYKWNGRLNKEAAIQRSFVNELIDYSLQGKLKCIWTSIANENSCNSKPIYGAMLRALGKIKGAPDMVFLWENGSGCMEFKSGKNKQTDHQKMFEIWCNNLGVNYEIVRSKEEAINILHKWKLLN